MALAFAEISRVTDAELVSRLEHLVKADRALGVKLIVHLGELAERKLYLGRGYSSMFDYCVNALGMSEAEAYLRILAARIGRRFPLVVERLAAGKVHLSGIKLLAPHLTEENHTRLLDQAVGMSKKQIEVLIAGLAPKPDAPSRLRKLPTKCTPVEDPLLARQQLTAASQSSLNAPQTPTCMATPAVFALQLPTTSTPVGPTTFVLQTPEPRASAKPLSPGRFKLEVTLGQEAHEKLEQLQELLRHQNPTGNLANIIERAVSVLLEREMKRRFAQTTPRTRRTANEAPDSNQVREQTRSRTASTEAMAHTSADLAAGEVSHGSNKLERSRRNEDATRQPVKLEPDVLARGARRSGPSTTAPVMKQAGSRYVPRDVVREVYARDVGRCTFVSPEGRRCTARGFLELHHHEKTFARGGAPTPDNLRLTCRAHNMFHAERDYGRRFMKLKLRDAGALVPGPVDQNDRSHAHLSCAIAPAPTNVG